MVKNFKYINGIIDGVGTINVYSQIGDSVDEQGNITYGINGSSFAYEMQYLETCCDVINVRINSIGGNVLDGYSIVSSILNCSKPVNTFIDGLAASTAGWVAVAGKKCSMASYGTFMMHDPSGGTDKNVTKLVKETIVNILTSRTGLTEEECSKMMKNETWLNAEECLKLNIVDEVVNCSKKIKMPKGESLYNMAIIYNKLLTPKNKMENINNKLKLAVDAPETEALNAIEAMQNSVTTLEAELKAEKEKVAAFEAEKKEKEDAEKAAFEKEVNEVIDEAVKSEKITAEEKAAVLANALVSKESFTFVKNMLDKVSNVVKSTVAFDVKNVKNNLGLPENRQDWTYSDWSKKDDKGLLKLQNEAPEVYKMLYKAEYGVEPTI